MAGGLDRGRAPGADPHRGGASKHLPDKAHHVNVPQHGLDVALAQAVSRRTAQSRACFANGKADAGRVNAQIGAMARDMLRRLLKDPWGTLSERQRAALERCLKPEILAKVLANAKVAAGVGRDMPECLWPENLPKKPPGR